MFSTPSLHLLAELLDDVKIPATHPHLEEVAAQVATARRELLAALTATADAAE